MTIEQTSISSKEEFTSELQELLNRAYNNGIGVEGGWECRNGVAHPDWDVIVYRMEKPDK